MSEKLGNDWGGDAAMEVAAAVRQAKEFIAVEHGKATGEIADVIHL